MVGYDPLDEMKSFTAKGRLHSAYSFVYLYADDISPDLVNRHSLNWPEGEGWPSWAFSNHDAPRAVSRWAQGRDRKAFAKCLMLLSLCQRGNVFVYQGEELGLEQADVPFKNLQDPEAIKNWPETLGRDGARTPMPWTSDPPHAGFSDAEPWLPVDPRHLSKSVASQEQDPTSMLNFTRALIRLRKESAALKIGRINFVDAPEGLLVFERIAGDDRFICVFNLGHEEVEFTPAGHHKLVFATALPNGTDGPATGPVPGKLPVCSGYIAT